MSRTSLGIAIMGTVALVVFIMGTAGPVPAEPFPDAGEQACQRNYNQCMDSCDRISGSRADGSAYARCIGKCSVALVNCNPQHPSPSSFAPPNDPTNPPPKGKGGLNPVTGGGISQPGGGINPPPKPIRGLEPINSGGAKQSGDFGTDSGTTTIYRSHVGGRKH